MMVPASINPYEAPESPDQVAPPRAAERPVALKNIRDALLILLIPAAWNYGCLFWGEFVGVPRGGRMLDAGNDPVFRVLALGNLFLLTAAFVGLWLLALKILDGIAVAVHHVCGGRTSRTAWLESMYYSLWTLRWASRLGAVCWIAWLILFFYARMFDPFWICFVMGTVGHLIGAWVYGTIFYNWYRLRQATPPPPGPDHS
jgi:hypothetical protein